jgi:4-carboxymuconolactone decarboxylase
MTRIQILTQDEMTDDQRRVYEAAVAGRRGRAPAPVIAWLKSPEFADRAQKLGEFVRYQTTLPPRLSELAILVTARFWTAQYEWFAHKQEALKAGLGPVVIDAVACRRRPCFENGDERVVYDFSRSLIETHSVHDDLYRATVDAVGERGVVELVGLLGYYTLISMTLNTFEIGVPNGARAELDP